MKKIRLPFTVFNLPVPELRMGHYAAVYFNREKRILELEGIQKKALMQVFNKVDDAVICGIDEALAILKVATGYWRRDPGNQQVEELFREYQGEQILIQHATCIGAWKELHNSVDRLIDLQSRMFSLWEDTHEDLTVQALYDGERSFAFDAIMTIEGRALDFAHLESVYLGVIARSTKVATNTARVVSAANGKSVLFFADRFDRWENQESDGHAAYMGGAEGLATDAMGHRFGITGRGTTPHALIAMYEGDTVEATLDFAKTYPGVPCIALVDFHNDCAGTSLEVARAFEKRGKELWGVRLDTSGSMVDKSVVRSMGQFKPTGVCAPLVEEVRTRLDRGGFPNVKIVVSGGFNANKVAEFESGRVPVDAYGVGSSLLRGEFDHTADIVEVDGEPMAKVGRKKRLSPIISEFSWDEIEDPF